MLQRILKLSFMVWLCVISQIAIAEDTSVTTHVIETPNYIITLPTEVQHVSSEQKPFDTNHETMTDVYSGTIAAVTVNLSISATTLTSAEVENTDRLQRDYLQGMLAGINRMLAKADPKQEFIEEETPIEKIILGEKTYLNMRIETADHVINVYTLVNNDKLFSFTVTQKTKDQAPLKTSIQPLLDAIASLQYK